MSFKEFIYFFKVVEFIGIKLVVILPYYPFNSCRICSNTASLILDTVICVSTLFFLIGLARGLSLLLMSSLSLFLLVLVEIYHSVCT